MQTSSINIHGFSDEAEKKHALNTIFSCFANRSIQTLESPETMAERIMDDADIQTSDGIIRALKHLCLSIWRDDVCDSYSYYDMVQRLNEISDDAVSMTYVQDGYSSAENGADFQLSFKANGKTYEQSLNRGRFTDYNFLKIVLQANQDSTADGEFYVVISYVMDEGFPLVYLNSEDVSKIREAGILDLIELDQAYIDEARASFFEPYMKPEVYSQTSLEEPSNDISEIAVPDSDAPFETSKSSKTKVPIVLGLIFLMLLIGLLIWL